MTLSRLSPRDHSVIQTINHFRQATSSQIRRLHFTEGSLPSCKVKSNRTLRRLVKWNEISRLPRPIGGGMGGSADYIYVSAGSRARIADPHTLDIIELFVRLKETCEVYADRSADKRLQVFDPEPYSFVQLGNIELKPDAYIEIQTDYTYQWFLELDLGTEWRTQLSQKMKRYNQAYNHWPESTFPQVLFVVPDPSRLRLIEGVIKRQEVPALFQVCLFDNAISLLTYSTSLVI